MRTLLLADDNITVQRVIALTFAAEQIQVVTCGDGQQAIERMAAQRPDIVLAGTSLPTVNGYELARFIRNKPELKDIPVLLLSGAFENVDEARLVSSGASGLIEKPVEPNNVIGRVKELLGLKAEEKPAAAGRLVTSADGPAAKKPPVPATPRGAATTRVMPPKTAPMPQPPAVDTAVKPAGATGSKPDDYLDTLDAAFDTLDQQLSGQAANAKSSRNPSGPLGQASGAPDPRSPGRQPRNTTNALPGNPVFEIDDEWFGGDDSKALADARAGRREIQEDLQDPELKGAVTEAAPNAVFEVDDDWFAEGDKTRAAKLDEQRTLAAEMGIHEVELPHADTTSNGSAPVSDLDFDFGLDDIKKLQETTPAEAAGTEVAQLIDEISAPLIESPAPVVAPASLEPLAPQSPLAPKALPLAPQAPQAPFAPQAPLAPQAPQAPLAPQAPVSPVADDFAQLLAFEQGEHHEPPMAPAPEVRIVAPEVTGEMLDQIATRVAERLSASQFGDTLQEAMTATIRDVARVVAYETSERIVREVTGELAERVIRQVASDTSDRVVREVASELCERVVRQVAHETSERVVRDVAADTSARAVRDIVAETSERLVRDEIERIKSKHQ